MSGWSVAGGVAVAKKVAAVSAMFQICRCLDLVGAGRERPSGPWAALTTWQWFGAAGSRSTRQVPLLLSPLTPLQLRPPPPLCLFSPTGSNCVTTGETCLFILEKTSSITRCALSLFLAVWPSKG